MFAEYEYNYDRIVNEADELLDYENSNTTEETEKEYSDYYFNLTEDIE